METLTEKQIKEIIKSKKINECSECERKQVFQFAFGNEFMKSNDKGEIKIYTEQNQ